MSAAFEGYYQWNFNRPPDRVNLLRAYDTRANVFGIQQAALVVEKAPDLAKSQRAGLRLDLQFGQATETVQGSPANEPRNNVYRHVWQAYGSYVFPMGRDVQVDFGKFASNLGYETNYAKDNNNFSRAYLFNFLPFYHSGVRTTIPVTDTITLMYMLTNGIQQTEDFNNFKSNHFTGIIKPTGAITWTVNYYFGQEQPDGGEPDGPDGFFKVFDTYVAYTASDKVSLGLDVDYVSSEVTKDGPEGTLTGLGVYARYQATTPAAVAVRYEWLDDEGGLFGGDRRRLSGNHCDRGIQVHGRLPPPWRLPADWSNSTFFPHRDPELREGQNTVLIGLVWWIGKRDLVAKTTQSELAARRARGRWRRRQLSRASPAALARRGAELGPGVKVVLPSHAAAHLVRSRRCRVRCGFHPCMSMTVFALLPTWRPSCTLSSDAATGEVLRRPWPRVTSPSRHDPVHHRHEPVLGRYVSKCSPAAIS